MDIPVKYEDVVAKLDAALGREAALLDQIGDLKSSVSTWRIHYDRVTGERDALQQRLAVAEQRVGELESAAREMIRIAGIANQGSNAYNRAIINLNAVLKPVETPYEYSGEDDFGHRERIAAALKPAAEGEGS